ncbi:MAG: spore coat protein CotJB [Bacilli bacterium]|jgi:spore coat protein JB|nr:spore coat protein CotJB [Bacilli bacterium]
MNKVNNMYYDNYSNVNDIVNIKNEEMLQKDLVNVSEGFRRGNIFPDLYWPYKKQTYNFVPNNERQRLLLEIMENSFYAHELNLYLDNYTTDKEKIDLFNKYNDKSNNLINEYNKKYEPIILNDLKEVPWAWEESPWPWEGV